MNSPPQSERSSPGQLESMDSRICDIQPGGGVVIQLEKLWGVVRRGWLKRFRPRYVERMRSLRHGDPTGVPHEVLDPRDLKLYRNQTDCHWLPEDDPFLWRERLPFVRVGLAELIVFSLLFWTPAVILVAVAMWSPWSLAVRVGAGVFATAFALLGVEMAWFFRNPRRHIPDGVGAIVSPADGTISRVERGEHTYVGGAAWEISIFLSVFNVHINRVPESTRVIGIEYQPGKCLNALRAESERENEQLTVRLEQSEPPYRRLIVRQITGAIARRIVCWVKPGDHLRRGEQFGMIKLGSRTVLVIPHTERLRILVKVGDKVQAGTSFIAQYDD